MRITQISHRVSLVMIGVVAVIILGFAGILIVEQRQSLERELANRVNIITQLAQKSLPFPMWNVDNQALNDFMAALLTDPAIVYAEYQIAGDVVFTTGKGKKTRPEFSDRPWQFFESTPQFLAQHITISNQSKELGFFRFAVSKASIQTDLHYRLLTVSLETIIVILAISLTALAITTRTILRPLQALQSSAERLAQGQLEEPIDVSRQDELGHLARSFANMRDAIRSKMMDLNRVNEELRQEITERKHIEAELHLHQEHLEEMVQNRTAELMTANKQLLTEIAERKRTEEALQHAKEAAEAANQAKSVFLTNMSHELRTPLNAILGFAQLMARNPHIPSEEQENLDIIQRSDDHLLILINQVLDLSKIEAGRITLNTKDFDLHRLLDDLENMFSLKAQNKGLHLLFERAEDVPQYVCTDEVKLRQVLNNVLNNAVKFTQAGSVTVRISDLGFGISDGKNLQSAIRNLKFEISDTGPGIAPEEMDTLFEAFAQTETGRQAQEGTGLGLAISRKFVQLMDGDLNIKSNVGEGTTFTFDIQVSIGHEQMITYARPPRRAITLEPDQPRYRLLIVDDKPDNRQLLVKLLTPFGFELREAANGQEAIDIWQEWEPHLIWMDLRMPVLDGYEATKEIRRAEEQKLRRAEVEKSRGTGEQKAVSSDQHPVSSIQHRTVVIAVTASSFEKERAVILSVGCDDFLRKPFREVEVLELLHKHLGVRFVYAEGEGHKAKGEGQKAEEVLTPEVIAALPDELCTGLHHAAEVIDPEMANRLIDRVREHNELLADRLADLVKNYRFDILQELLSLHCS